MQKTIFFLSMVFAFVIGQVYAADYSVGVTPHGFGRDIRHSGNAKEVREWIEGKATSKNNFGLSIFPMVQVDFIVEFLPYLALETGIGYGLSVFSLSSEENGIEQKRNYKKDGIIIPFMIRGQYVFGALFVYASIGPKFVIPISDYRTMEVEGKEVTGDSISLAKTGFIMDMSFAIGSEIQKGERYIGFRIGYDLNLTSPIHEGHGSDIYEDWYHDNLNVSFTFRHDL